MRAARVLRRLPAKQAICCPACGCAMKFLHALRPRARPPPGIASLAGLP